MIRLLQNSWPAKSTRVGIDLSECPPSLAKASYTANGSNWLSAIAIPVGAQCRDVAVITSPLTRYACISGNWNAFQGKGLTDLSSFGPPFPNQHNGSAIGLMVKKIKCCCFLGSVCFRAGNATEFRTMIEAFVPPLGTNSQDNRSTGSVALMLESELDEFTKLGGWIEMKQSNPKHLEWAVTVADDSEDSVGWGRGLPSKHLEFDSIFLTFYHPNI
ncbi:hypothetical protein C1H46_016424 [Malus baccata]|uniref:Uncharacterized protein n=1 Tax=Malus baccata TaxID=106549 RepID=A0A540MHK3_MALBA|nr:hypothetical protein C1H46_016424 [Malus baccata]